MLEAEGSLARCLPKPREGRMTSSTSPTGVRRSSNHSEPSSLSPPPARYAASGRPAGSLAEDLSGPRPVLRRLLELRNPLRQSSLDDRLASQPLRLRGVLRGPARKTSTTTRSSAVRATCAARHGAASNASRSTPRPTTARGGLGRRVLPGRGQGRRFRGRGRRVLRADGPLRLRPLGRAGHRRLDRGGRLETMRYDVIASPGAS